MNGRLLAYMQLLRVPNVFTAIADVVMGALIAYGIPALDDVRAIAIISCLAVASSAIYMSGMALNDYFDVEVDREERPHRPLPSGRIERSTALYLAILLQLFGLALAFAAGIVAVTVALLLIVAVWLYDGLLKHSMMGPVAMGACRTLNVFLGLSIVPSAVWLFDTTSPPIWRFGSLVAFALGFYIMAVTRLARDEASGGHRIDMTSKSMVLNLALLLLGFGFYLPKMSAQVIEPVTPDMPFFVSQFATFGSSWPSQLQISAVALWGVVLVTVNYRLIRAIVGNTPPLIQTAIKTAILSLIVLDAAAVAFVLGPVAAGSLLLLLVPALTVGKWVYST